MGRAIDHDFLYDLPALSAPRISPNGRSVIYARTDIDREAQRAESRLEVTAGGCEPRRLTAGPRDSAPRWSPDGGTIAFLRAAEEKQPPQLWLLPSDGGEARKLSSLDGGVAAFAWAPDGASLVAVCRVDPEAPAKEDRDDEIPRVKVVSGRIRYRGDGEGWFGAARAQLFRIDADAGDARRLTRGDHNHTQPAVSPDGSTIAFVSSDRGPQRHRREPMGTELCLIPAEAGRVTRLVRNGWSFGSPTWSPDGKRIAYVAGDRAEAQRYVEVVEVATSEVTRLTTDELTPTVGQGASDLSWVGRRIVFTGDVRGSTGVYAASARGVEVLRRPSQTAIGLTLSRDGRRGALLTTSTDRPAEVATFDLRARRVRRVTHATETFVADHDLTTAEPFRIRRGGDAVEGWLMHPRGYDPAKRYPLVLSIHGGPSSHFSPMFVPMHQQLSAAGMHVLYKNPRGSTSYGSRWAAAVNGDWGGEDYEDQMAAVDAASARDDVDARRLGVYGYSYGGYMSAWTIGQTDRFRAAAVGAPVIDLSTNFYIDDIGVALGDIEWRGTPWDEAEHHRERSPLTYAGNVETPVLLLHGEDDLRCPIAGTEAYYTALAYRGKEVEFVRFSGGSHGFTRTAHPALRVEYSRRVVGWFRRHLGRSRSR